MRGGRDFREGLRPSLTYTPCPGVEHRGVLTGLATLNILFSFLRERGQQESIDSHSTED
jgi:hypothetical protein